MYDWVFVSCATSVIAMPLTRRVDIVGGALGLLRAAVRRDHTIRTFHRPVPADSVVLLRISSARLDGCARAAVFSSRQDSGYAFRRGARPQNASYPVGDDSIRKGGMLDLDSEFSATRLAKLPSTLWS